MPGPRRHLRNVLCPFLDDGKWTGCSGDPAQDVAGMVVVGELSEVEAHEWLRGRCGRDYVQAMLQAEALGDMGIFRDGIYACPDEVGYDLASIIEEHLADLDVAAWVRMNPDEPGITPERSLAFKAPHLRWLRLRAGDDVVRPTRLNTLEADPGLAAGAPT